MWKNECGLNSRLVELDENNFPTHKTGAQFNDTQKNKHTHKMRQHEINFPIKIQFIMFVIQIKTLYCSTGRCARYLITFYDRYSILILFIRLVFNQNLISSTTDSQSVIIFNQ